MKTAYKVSLFQQKYGLQEQNFCGWTKVVYLVNDVQIGMYIINPSPPL